MPLVRRRRYAKKSKPTYRKRRQYSGYRGRRTNTSTSQVFSETYKCGTECGGVNAQGEVYIVAGQTGTGLKLQTAMNVVPQAGNYRNLWTAYKIIKAKFTIIPKWHGESQNEAAIGTAGGIGITETPRLAYAIQDMDDGATPLSELSVLQDNGCRVRMFNRPVKVTLRPKPLLEQVGGQVVGLPNVNTQQNRGQWIEFDGAGSTVTHVGVNGFISAYNSLTTGFLAVADVYCTVSFVCKDPR